jgi:hypothetical protein
MTMTENETTTRAALELALKDADAAQRDAAKAREAVATASTMLSKAERDLAAARGALEEARAPQRPLAELLAATASDAEAWEVLAEHNKGRPAVTAEDLREARSLVLDAEDRVIVAGSTLERLQQSATSAEAAARRADARRRAAICDVVQPEVIRLMRAVERLTTELGEARLALRFVGANLVGGMGDERRQISRMLDMDLGQMFAREFGFRAEPSVAEAAWEQFAEAIARDSLAPFPT